MIAGLVVIAVIVVVVAAVAPTFLEWRDRASTDRAAAEYREMWERRHRGRES